MPIDLLDSESELNTAPSAVEKRKATATKSSSRKVHEPGTGGLPETSDSDSEEEEEDDDEDKEGETQESLLQDDEESDEESDMESDDDFEEGANGGFPAKVSKKSKRKVHKSPLSTVFFAKGAIGYWWNGLISQAVARRPKGK